MCSKQSLTVKKSFTFTLKVSLWISLKGLETSRCFLNLKRHFGCSLCAASCGSAEKTVFQCWRQKKKLTWSIPAVSDGLRPENYVLWVRTELSEICSGAARESLQSKTNLNFTIKASTSSEVEAFFFVCFWYTSSESFSGQRLFLTDDLSEKKKKKYTSHYSKINLNLKLFFMLLDNDFFSLCLQTRKYLKYN